MTAAHAAARAVVGRAAFAVFLLAWLAYGAALAGDFVFDDFHSVAANPALRDLGNLGAFWTDPSLFSAGQGAMYRPALLTSFALNLAVSPAAASLKAGNVLLHAAVATLLFGWLWRLSRRLRASFVVAALFAAHPLASEAVNLVSARSELLSTLGLLLALHGQLGWLRGGPAGRGLALTLLGTLVACGAKETGVAAPALALLQGLWLGRGPWRARGRAAMAQVLPMAVVVASYLVARKLLLGEVAVALLDRVAGDPTLGGGRTLTTQLATMGALLPASLLQVVWPWRLSFDPPVVYRESLAAWPVLAGWSMMLATTLGACWPGRRAGLRRLGAAAAWALALPWVVIPLNMPVAEHRMYGPLAGLALVAVALAPRWRRAAPVVVARVAVALLLAAFVGRAAHRSWQYRDERTLWQVELAADPASFRGWWGLGTSILRAGDVVGAIEPLAKAHELRPTHAQALCNYVEALTSLPDAAARPGRAVAMAAALRALRPDDPWVRTLQAQALLQRGRVDGDAASFRAAEAMALSCLAIAEPKAYVFRLAAFARAGLRDPAGALQHLDDSVARGLAPVELRLERAELLQQLGRAADARRELFAAQQIAPDEPAVRQALLRLAAPPR